MASNTCDISFPSVRPEVIWATKLAYRPAALSKAEPDVAARLKVWDLDGAKGTGPRCLTPAVPFFKPGIPFHIDTNNFVWQSTEACRHGVEWCLTGGVAMMVIARTVASSL